MITISCPVTGVPTDVPTLTLDPRDGVQQTPYEGQIIATADLRSAVFRLRDDEPTVYGVTVRYLDRAVHFAIGRDTPPTLEYPPAVERLIVDGHTFRTESGARKIVGLHSDFKLLKLFLEGEDVGAILDARMSAVNASPILARGPRVFGTCGFLFPLDPGIYGDRYYEALPAFSRLLAARGLYWEYVAFADAQTLRIDQRRHWRRALEALDYEPNVIIELANEYQKNGIDPGMFERVGTRALSRGSGLGDYPPYGGLQGEGLPWDYGTFHPRRDWKWPFTVAQTVNEIQRYLHLNVAILVDEPIGADEHNEPNRRSTDAEAFEKMAVDCALWAAGGTFHSTAGLTSQPWGETQTRCAQAFFRGLTR